MSIQPGSALSAETEASLVARAKDGDGVAYDELIETVRRPLFAYIYRMVTHRQDAEDLMQDVLVRVLKNLQDFRQEARFRTWLFGIATHVCLDHLRHKKRWRVEAQLIGEQEATADQAASREIRSLVSQPDFVFEIREHIAFCFSCVGRTLAPEEQAALLLREVLEFTGAQAAGIMGVSEPVFRHRLASARKTMDKSYEGLCQLINKTGVCWQCKGLREITPEAGRGQDLVQIEVAPGLSVTPENLLNARLGYVSEADLETGKSRPLHDMFYEILTRQEESSS